MPTLREAVEEIWTKNEALELEWVSTSEDNKTAILVSQAESTVDMVVVYSVTVDDDAPAKLTREERYKRRCWTPIYTPFTMGGDVWRPRGFVFYEAESKRVELGKGFYGYVLKSPKGKTVIVEERSGGIVGSSLEQVQADIAQAEQDVMEKQVADATAAGVSTMSEMDFWDIYDRKTI